VVYEHDVSGCFAESVGAGGLTPRLYAAALKRTRPALDAIRAWHAAAEKPFLTLPRRRDDLALLAPLVDKASRKYTDLVVLGTGGSSLGGRAIAALRAHPVPPASRAWLHFADNIDPRDFEILIDGLDLAHTLFLVISKSGGTAETLTQFLIALEAVRRDLGDDGAASAFIVIPEPGDNPLRRVAGRWKLAVFDHDPALGGRYSALSLVGLLPAMFAGVDAAQVRAGAEGVLEGLLAADDPAACPPAVGAALQVGLAEKRGVSATVLMPYCDRLIAFAAWFRQLWAESLGKGGKGTIPVPALGAVDQHSQLQLYLDGPADKLFTLITLDAAGLGKRVEPGLIDGDPALAYLAGHTMGDLLDAEQRATAESLRRHGRPLRMIRLAALDERALGALLMHFMLETVIAAQLWEVDPFDQPAVEEGKVLARRWLAGAAEAEA